MKFLSAILDYNDYTSWANAIRRRRHQIFLAFVRSLGKSNIRILDVGGDYRYWQNVSALSFDPLSQIVLLNLRPSLPDDHDSRFLEVIGDARKLSFKNREFDIVFSNSVIEHLLPGDQSKMAQEIVRVGWAFFVQTPNRYFPLCAHTYIPFFPILPLFCKMVLIRCFNIHWHKRQTTWDACRKEARNLNLLSIRDFQNLFPSAQIYRERFFGLCKSMIAMGPSP